MNENQLKWLFDLQSKGVKFEYCNMKGEWVNNGRCTFFAAQKNCRIPTQPIPDIPDWRELCREMQSNGVRFENSSASGNNWFTGRLWGFNADIEAYRIPQQPLPEWKEEMNEETKPDPRKEVGGDKVKMFKNLRITDADFLEKIDQYMKDNPDSVIPVDEAQIARITELVKDVKIDEETKPDPREEIPHRELQIQWHEDMLHHLRTGEPMPVWEYRLKNGDGEWRICHDPHFSEKYEYRRKPKEVTYYHCVISRLDKTTGLTITSVVTRFSKDDLESYVRGEKFKGQSTKLGPIVETTVEMDD